MKHTTPTSDCVAEAEGAEVAEAEGAEVVNVLKSISAETLICGGWVAAAPVGHFR